ncbi:MAG: hypothetical protein KC766_42390 [Myxococcales bacterium]|nr:hypothetical protein [Myxococcales bacterium]
MAEEDLTKPDRIPPASKWETITKMTYERDGIRHVDDFQVMLFDGLIRTNMIMCYFDDRRDDKVRLFSTQPLLDAGAMQIRSINTVHTEFKCDKKDCRDYESNQGLFYLPEITMHKDKAWV